MADSNLDAMRAELKAMRQELNDLRDTTSTCVTAPPVIVGSPDGSGGAAVDVDNDLQEGSPDGGGGAAVDVEAVQFQQKSSLLMEDLRDHTIRVSEKHWVVALEPSCWSIPLIANKKSRAETGILMLLFLTNLALQSVFCFVVYWILGASTGEAKKNTYSERTVQELVEWRRSIAHEANFYKRATLRSMAQRVCDGDAGLESSTSQQERYELLAAYIGGVDEARTNFGAWMATACLFVFVLSMVKELRGTLHLGVAVAALPAGKRTELRSAEDGDDDGGTISLLRISHARRGIALAALVLRAVRDAVLLWFGCRWLINTVDLGELLLNAVALEFVTSCVEIKILRRVRAESSRRPPRHRRYACSMAWRCRFLAARPSQVGRVNAPDALVDFHTGARADDARAHGAEERQVAPAAVDGVQVVRHRVAVEEVLCAAGGGAGFVARLPCARAASLDELCARRRARGGGAGHWLRTPPRALGSCS